MKDYKDYNYRVIAGDRIYLAEEYKEESNGFHCLEIGSGLHCIIALNVIRERDLGQVPPMDHVTFYIGGTIIVEPLQKQNDQ